MKRNSKYVGLDVHQAMTAATVRTEGGRVVVRSLIETSERSITEFFSAMRGAVHVAFEEGTQAQWLYDLLNPRVDRVIVCNVRGTERSGNKGDRLDADDLSEQLRVGGLRAVYHGSRERADLEELTRAYRNLVEDSTRAVLRLKALFRARAIRTIGGSVYDPTKRAVWVAQLPPGARQRAETLYAQLDVLRVQRKKTKAAMVAEAKRDPAWAVLETIPYYGPVRIALLLATIGTPWRFRTKHFIKSDPIDDPNEVPSWQTRRLTHPTHRSLTIRPIQPRSPFFRPDHPRSKTVSTSASAMCSARRRGRDSSRRRRTGR